MQAKQRLPVSGTVHRMTFRLSTAIVTLAAAAAMTVWAEDSIIGPDAGETPSIRSAVGRGLEGATKAAGRYSESQSCFSCHHQTLPLLAAVTARDHGLAIDETLLPAQKAFTHASFHDDLDDLRAGRGIGGRAMTVGYGLWALRLADTPADETTEAMIAYLLKTQHDDGHWSRQTSRPPLEDSNVTCTTLAIYGLQKYAAVSQRPAAKASVEKGVRWLDKAPLECQEGSLLPLVVAASTRRTGRATRPCPADCACRPTRRWRLGADRRHGKRRVRHRPDAVDFASDRFRSSGRGVSAREQILVIDAVRRRVVVRAFPLQAGSTLLRQRQRARQGPIYLHARRLLGHRCAVGSDRKRRTRRWAIRAGLTPLPGGE